MLFEPKENGNYINDHCIVKGSDGNWHLYGITSFEGIPTCERYFAHGVGESLEYIFNEVGRSIDRGTLAWAPCVIEKEYIMYVSGVYNKRGAVSCFSSEDLLNWNFEGYASTSGEEAPLKPAWGAMESPYVVKKDGLFYLFITYTDCSDENYNNTLVFCSKDPKNFGMYNGDGVGAKPVMVLQAHAPEILFENGKYYITTCGWRKSPIPNKGAVSVATLEWK